MSEQRKASGSLSGMSPLYRRTSCVPEQCDTSDVSLTKQESDGEHENEALDHHSRLACVHEFFLKVLI